MKDSEEEIYPYISDGLISYLERNFPDRMPLKELRIFEYGKNAGIQEVINHLREVKKWSEEKDVQIKRS